MALGEPGDLVRPTIIGLMMDAYPTDFVQLATGENPWPEWLLHFAVRLREGIPNLGFPPNQPFLVDVYDGNPAADKLHEQRLKALMGHTNTEIRVRLKGWRAARSDALRQMAESRPHCVTHVVPAPVRWQNWQGILAAGDNGLLAAAAYEALPTRQSLGPHTIVFEAFAGLMEMEASVAARVPDLYRYYGVMEVPVRILTAPISLLLQPPDPPPGEPDDPPQ